MNKIFRRLLFLIVLAYGQYALAMSASERALVEAAGEYYGAIMLAKEFKGARCGGISIATKWTDLSRAKRDIFKKLPKRLHAEMERDWNEFHDQARVIVEEAIVMFNSEKAVNAGCDKVQDVFWVTFDAAVKRWSKY
jgi:hypothetical protein